MVSLRVKSITLALILAYTAVTHGQTWDMTDRYTGLRFELRPYASSNLGNFLSSIVKKADDLYAFGWVQANTGGRVGGEFRGRKDGMSLNLFICF